MHRPGLGLFCLGKMPGLCGPRQKLCIYLFGSSEKDVVRPPAGVRLHRYGNARRVQPAGKAQREHQTMLGPVFFAADGQGGSCKKMAAVKN